MKSGKSFDRTHLIENRTDTDNYRVGFSDVFSLVFNNLYDPIDSVLLFMAFLLSSKNGLMISGNIEMTLTSIRVISQFFQSIKSVPFMAYVWLSSTFQTIRRKRNKRKNSKT